MTVTDDITFKYLPDHGSHTIIDGPYTSTMAHNNIESASLRLLTSIKGQTIQVPNLNSILAGWPVEINPDYEKMVPVVNRKLERSVLPRS